MSLSIPINRFGNSTKKLERLLGEHLFVRKNFSKFTSLSRLEKVTLRKIAEGRTSEEMGAELFISTVTEKTYRNRIKKKLKVKHLVEMLKNALAFELTN